MGEFGDKFRKAREKKGISLDDASNVTKIGARMLQAIEEEHFDQLPGGVFNKGFIRAYAKHLGINDQEAVTEYLECLRQEQVRAQAVWEPQARPAAPEKRAAATTAVSKAVKAPAATVQTALRTEELPDLQLPRPEHARPPHQKSLGRRESGIPRRLIVATVVVLGLALVLWRRHSEGNPTQRASSPSSTMAAPSAVQPTSGQSSSGQALSGQASAGQPSAAQPASVAANSGTATSTNGSPVSHPASRVNPSGNAPAPDNASVSRSDENEVTTRSFVNAPPKITAETATAPLMLVIRATENSWISVSADGKRVSQETLIAPANTTVRATREIVAKVGNAAGVTFVWNGKEVPADGAESETKTFVFDVQGMRVVATNPSANQTP